MGIGQCVQVAPFWRSQTLAGSSLDFVFLDDLGAAEVQEMGPGLCDAPALKTWGRGHGQSCPILSCHIQSLGAKHLCGHTWE